MKLRSDGTASRSAALRAARRRACASLPLPHQPRTIEPLPPLVCPDDDREFVDSRERQPQHPAPEPMLA
jgi:hypothetical protein